MRAITIGLLVAGFALQGCGSPTETPVSSDPSSNVADMSNVTNEAEPYDAQAVISNDGTHETGGASNSGSPFLDPSPTVGPSPTPSNAPPPANAVPQPR